jgi:alpha-tubulin suppressor-like RCC1 family protein
MTSHWGSTFGMLALLAACGDHTGPPPPPPPPQPTQLAFVVQPGQTLRDSVIAPSITVEVRDASGSRIPGATNTVTVSLGANPGGATLVGTASVAAVDGIATFANLHLSERGRGYTLVASGGSLGSDTSPAFSIVVPMIPNSVTPGTGHTCAQVGYGLFCWGRNDNGELGDSTLTLSTLPVPVPFTWPGGASVAGVALGDSHTCVTTSVAELYCWGSDSSGQLGIGSQNDRRIFPTLVSGGISFVGVTAGRAHTCAGTVPNPDSTYVYCWGANDRGQVGDSTNSQRTTPVAVAERIAFSAATAGRDHTCAIATATGKAYCWGDNTFGQLGDSSTSARNSPVPVAGGHTFNQISAGGNHTCGLTNTPEVYCWGDNADGELGDSTTTQRTVPVKVAGGVTLAGIAVGSRFSCGESIDQKLYCWGRNLDGQLGIGSFASQLTPQLVGGNINPTGITGGDRHACATTFDGVAYCWGANTFGQVGDGTRATRPSPVLILY